LAVALTGAGCSTRYDVGSTIPHGRLPVDERNPILLVNDGAYDNWQGEYAVLLANNGGAKLAGIIVNDSTIWPDININIDGWRALVGAARVSGLGDIPDPITSLGAPLVRPASGAIDETTPNRSEGARFIVEASARLGLPYRPLVIVTGGRLTDVADAYFVDRTVVDRVVVVASLGRTTSTGGAMGDPNGQLDPWADLIVAELFRYVQVSAFYDQNTDLPPSHLAELPANPFAAWVAAKQPQLQNLLVAADQVGVAAVGIPDFAAAVQTVSVSTSMSARGPDLLGDPAGEDWLVTKVDGAKASTRFLRLLLDPTTYTR
jgi:hypothetical protein